MIVLVPWNWKDNHCTLRPDSLAESQAWNVRLKRASNIYKAWNVRLKRASNIYTELFLNVGKR
jgi:hypothetical protein